MSIISTVTQIDTQTLQYAPAVLAAIQAAELSGQSGSNKKQAVLDGVLKGAQVAENIPIPQVQAIAGMVDMFVSIFNSLGIFKKSNPVPMNQPVLQPLSPSTPVSQLTQLNPNIK